MIKVIDFALVVVILGVTIVDMVSVFVIKVKISIVKNYCLRKVYKKTLKTIQSFYKS